MTPYLQGVSRALGLSVSEQHARNHGRSVIRLPDPVRVSGPRGASRCRTRRVSSADMMASRHRSRPNSGGGFGGFFGLLLVFAIIVKFIWWILAAAVIVGLFFLVRAVVRESRKRADAHARHCAAIAARADQQHR